MLGGSRGCDVVLGIQWLITLGPILWDFKELTMQFNWQGSSITWTGLHLTPWTGAVNVKETDL